MRKALITGISGQDGSYLADLLLAKGYEVHGIVRRASLEDPARKLARLSHLKDRIALHAVNVESFPSLFDLLTRQRFAELYHFAGHSFVAEEFADGHASLLSNVNSAFFILETVRQLQPQCRVYFAGSSEMYGDPNVSPQSEATPFYPRNAYGLSKLTGYHLVRNYRERHGLHCVTGIAFNHESPRRGFEFVTRKITSGAARIALGLADKLALGNLDARRDWGHAEDYVRAMHAMLQLDKAEDLVIATGKTHRVRDLCKIAFDLVGLDYRDHVQVAPQLLRGERGGILCGDPTRAREVLGWRPEISFKAMIEGMVAEDLEAARSAAAGAAAAVRRPA